MTKTELECYFIINGIVARIFIDSKKHRVTFRIHPFFIEQTKESLEDMQPAGVQYVYKPMRLWDYWKCRERIVVVG